MHAIAWSSEVILEYAKGECMLMSACKCVSCRRSQAQVGCAWPPWPAQASSCPQRALHRLVHHKTAVLLDNGFSGFEAVQDS